MRATSSAVDFSSLPSADDPFDDLDAPDGLPMPGPPLRGTALGMLERARSLQKELTSVIKRLEEALAIDEPPVPARSEDKPDQQYAFLVATADESKSNKALARAVNGFVALQVGDAAKTGMAAKSDEEAATATADAIALLDAVADVARLRSERAAAVELARRDSGLKPNRDIEAEFERDPALRDAGKSALDAARRRGLEPAHAIERPIRFDVDRVLGALAKVLPGVAGTTDVLGGLQWEDLAGAIYALEQPIDKRWKSCPLGEATGSNGVWFFLRLFADRLLDLEREEEDVIRRAASLSKKWHAHRRQAGGETAKV